LKIQLNTDSGTLGFRDSYFGPGDSVEVTDEELNLIKLSGFTAFTKVKPIPNSKEIQ